VARDWLARNYIEVGSYVMNVKDYYRVRKLWNGCRGFLLYSHSSQLEVGPLKRQVNIAHLLEYQ
jgi:hypothetical protein